MKLNTSIVYGIVAAVNVAKTEGLVISKVISKEYSIPLEYLLKIMQQLTRANILKSKRGPRGGFSLARPANKISLLDIVEAIEGPIANNIAISDIATKGKFGKKADSVFNKAMGESKKVLKQTKLSDLL